MQRVIHEYRNCSRIFTMLENLYTHITDLDNEPDEIPWLDKSCAKLTQILTENLFNYQEPRLLDFELPRVPAQKNDPNEITVCLSGGKDSAALVLYYVQKGYKVHLYHAHGVNKAYGDERLAATNIAKYFNLDLFVDNFNLAGTQPFIEHPMKNYVIANGAIHYCLANGFTPHIAFGNFYKSVLDENEFTVCAGDCIDMWEAYTPIIQTVIPEFEIQVPFATNADTFNLLEGKKDLLGLCVSCMSPYRFRAHWKKRTENKYVLQLLDNRCGCCWKCCMEAIWLMDTDSMFYTKEYYFHCLCILAGTILKETGRHPDMLEVWNQYMWYPIEKSKAYAQLAHGGFIYYASGVAKMKTRNRIYE